MTYGNGRVWYQACHIPACGRAISPSLNVDGKDSRRQLIKEIQMSNKKGFTLIELLIVVVIIGILAAIAIPKFANTKDKAYVAAMKSDLRNLATYEEQYAADNGGSYFGGTATMAAPLQGFTPSQNVTIVATNVAGPPPSWSANATHSQSAKVCDMTNGVITCV
jgi:prepilin-type N-terminal cleavage/methylation domain-containing protein